MRRGLGLSLAGRALGLSLASLALVSACSITVEQGTPAAPTASAGDTGLGADGSPADLSPGPTGPIAIDRGLLAALPRTVSGLALVEDSDADDALLADDIAPRVASAGVGAVVADTQTNDLATAFVLRLLPTGFTDQVFANWRDAFDAAACQDESQVVGQAEADVAGNHVYIGTCATGLRTYHAWLKDKGILISMYETGDKRLGLAILGNLPK
jgi:hypothetical protein